MSVLRCRLTPSGIACKATHDVMIGINVQADLKDSLSLHSHSVWSRCFPASVGRIPRFPTTANSVSGTLRPLVVVGGCLSTRGGDGVGRAVALQLEVSLEDPHLSRERTREGLGPREKTKTGPCYTSAGEVFADLSLVRSTFHGKQRKNYKQERECQEIK